MKFSKEMWMIIAVIIFQLTLVGLYEWSKFEDEIFQKEYKELQQFKKHERFDQIEKVLKGHGKEVDI